MFFNIHFIRPLNIFMLRPLVTWSKQEYRKRECWIHRNKFQGYKPLHLIISNVLWYRTLVRTPSPALRLRAPGLSSGIGRRFCSLAQDPLSVLWLRAPGLSSGTGRRFCSLTQDPCSILWLSAPGLSSGTGPCSALSLMTQCLFSGSGRRPDPREVFI